jgi:hypothetical protein
VKAFSAVQRPVMVFVPAATPVVFPTLAPAEPSATQESEIAFKPDGVTLTDSTQYGAGATAQGWNTPLGSVTLAFALGCPITTAAIKRNAEVKLANTEVRFI